MGSTSSRDSLHRLDDDVVNLARAEGVGPLLGARVVGGDVMVPPERRDEVVWDYHRCIGDNLVRARALEELVQRFQDRAVPVVLLKGMALIQSTFAPGERSMSDVDVLVPPSRWHEACGLAVEAGLTQEEMPGRSYSNQNDYVRSFVTPQRVIIEIHRFVCERTIFEPDYEGSDGIFARARRSTSGWSSPDDEDLFLTLVAHAAKHTFELPLRSYVDGIALLRKQRLSLDRLAARARAWRMEAAFRAWMLCLARLEGVQGDGPLDAAAYVGRSCGRFLWSRTTHANPWQRFLRLAWLTDGALQWTRHVASRSMFRAMDAVLSSPWLSSDSANQAKVRRDV